MDLAAKLPDLVSCATTWTKPGKVVLLMPDQPSRSSDEPDKGPLRVRSDRAYLLVGHYGKATRAVATWLVERGAQHLVFLYSSTEKVLDHDRFEVELKSMGCTTVWILGEITREEHIVDAIRSVNIPFSGVLHLTSTSKVGS